MANQRSHLYLQTRPSNQTEFPMQYKTIVLQLLEQRPNYYTQLTSQRKALETLNTLAQELKDNHEMLQTEFLESNPAISLELIASQALELAVQNLERNLPCEPPLEGDDQISLDLVMNSVRRHLPPA